MKTALLFTTHIFDDEVLERFRAIEAPGVDAYLMMDADRASNTQLSACVRTFSLATLKAQGYSLMGDTVVPGHSHLPTVEFTVSHDYDFVWQVEYDVVCRAWSEFFRSHAASTADFLTARLRTVADDPAWHWWPTCRYLGQAHVIPPGQMHASFNPVFRLSKRGAKAFKKRSLEGWSGHNEMLLPTLMKLDGLTVEDFGRRWWSENTYIAQPIKAGAGDELYHPVKLLTQTCLQPPHELPPTMKLRRRLFSLGRQKSA